MYKRDVCTDANGASCATDVATFMFITFAPVATLGDQDNDGISDEQDLCDATAPEDFRSIDESGCKNLVPIPKIVFALNAGGEAYTSVDGILYSADDGSYFTGSLGSTAGTPTHDIANTQDDDLYRRERWGKTLEFRLPIDNGIYQLELHMAEVFFTAANQRVMDISVEANNVLSGYDPFAQSGGKNFAQIENIKNVSVADLFPINILRLRRITLGSVPCASVPSKQ